MDLSTTYMGLELANPLVPSSSPLTGTLDGLRRLEDAGAGAVVLPSLFEEQVSRQQQMLDPYLCYRPDQLHAALGYYPETGRYTTHPADYLEMVGRARSALTIPVIASLNGVSVGGWVSYARQLEAAGASALELNIYYLPTMPTMSGPEVERMYVEIVHEVKRGVSIPVAVKLSPWFSAFAHMAGRLCEAGANALVLFNRFYQPDIDLEALTFVPRVHLSAPQELQMPLHWVALLYDRIWLDFAITSGIHTHFDVLKGLLVGARVTMMASALLQHGPAYLSEVLRALPVWMEQHGFASVRDLQGRLSLKSILATNAFERAGYMRVLQSWDED
jgi:dihydroorotate dehydrogenase (fumarate)